MVTDSENQTSQKSLFDVHEHTDAPRQFSCNVYSLMFANKQASEAITQLKVIPQKSSNRQAAFDDVTAFIVSQSGKPSCEAMARLRAVYDGMTTLERQEACEQWSMWLLGGAK